MDWTSQNNYNVSTGDGIDRHGSMFSIHSESSETNITQVYSMSETSEVEEGRIGSGVEEESGLPLWSIIGILLAAVALGYIVYDGLKSETYFYTVDEAIAQGSDLHGQRVRIKGIVESGSIEGKDGQLFRRFRVAEKGKSLVVTYERAMPDTFEEDREVVVLGTVNEKNILEAEEVIVKCPSRYEGAPPTATEKPQASL